MFHEYVNRLKNEQNLTNQQISEISGVPKSSVDRMLREEHTLPSLENAAAVISALGGSLDVAMGISPEPVELPQQSPEDTRGILLLLRDVVTRIVILHNTADKQRDAVIAEYGRFRSRVMFVSLLINAAFFALLIYDFTHPEIGWIQFDITAKLQQSFIGGLSVCAALWARLRA